MKKLISVLIIMLLALFTVGCIEKVDNKEVTIDENQVESNDVQEQVTDNTKFVSFKGEDMEGNEVTEKIFSENKLTMINIWGTTCPPCINEMPYIEEINNEMKDSGFELIGVVAGGKASKIDAEDIFNKLDLHYRNLLLDDKYLMALKVQYVPTTFFVNSEGEILGEAHIGAISKEEYLEIINGYLEK